MSHMPNFEEKKFNSIFFNETESLLFMNFFNMLDPLIIVPLLTSLILGISDGPYCFSLSETGSALGIGVADVEKFQF